MNTFEGGRHLELNEKLPNVQSLTEGGELLWMPKFPKEQMDRFSELPPEVQASILAQFEGLRQSLGVVEWQKQAAYTSALA